MAAVRAAHASGSRIGAPQPPHRGPRLPRTWPRAADRGVGLLGALLAALLLLATAVVGIAPLRPPSVPPGDTVADFPLDRAREDLAAVAAVPHPLGSPAQARVEAYLLQELTAMGLDPRVEAKMVTMAPDPPHSVWTGTVRNVVVRVQGAGPDADQAVLLAAHYDSVPTSPGAGDNGAGVVSVLAALRALTTGAPPRHDVVAAFVDGEEHEMLGALALVQSADWLNDVQVAVNTEGVGNAGRVTPALTTPQNGWVLAHYLDAVRSPVVYSAFDAPLNATGQGADLGRYQAIVPAGLELVVVGGLPAYHSGTDTAAAMDDGTLAEYVSTVVALARQLSAADLGTVRAPSLVAFTVTGGLTVAYPSTWSLPLAVVAGAAVVAVIALARRRRRVRLGRVLLMWLGLALAGLAGVLAATGLWLGARLVDPRLSDALNGAVPHRTPYVLAAVAAAGAGMLLVLWPLRRRAGSLEVVAGGLVGWGLVTLLLAALLPDAAYAATWPLLAAVVGFGVLAARERSPRVTLVVSTLAAVPAVLLLGPLVVLYFLLAALFELMLPVATPMPVLWVGLALSLVLPLLLTTRGALGWRPAATVGGLAVLLAAVGVGASAASSSPRPDLLVYHAGADAGTARWVALPPEPDAYTGQVVHDGRTPTRLEASPFHQPGATVPASTVPASGPLPADLPTAGLTVTSDVTGTAGREVTLRLTPTAGSYALTVDLASSAGVDSISVNGAAVPAATAGSPGTVRVVAFNPDTSIPVIVRVPVEAGLEVATAVYTTGLPAIPGSELDPRPGGLTTGVHELPDSTMVTQVTRLPAGGG